MDGDKSPWSFSPHKEDQRRLRVQINRQTEILDRKFSENHKSHTVGARDRRSKLRLQALGEGSSFYRVVHCGAL